MTIVEFFDPHNIVHVRAYRHLEKTGSWPEGFLPEPDCEWPLLWHAGLASKLAHAWLDSIEAGLVTQAPQVVVSKQDFDEADAAWEGLCDLAGIPKGEPWNVRAFAQIGITKAQVAKYNHIEEGK